MLRHLRRWPVLAPQQVRLNVAKEVLLLEELLHKLIEIDRQARSRVQQAQQARSQLLDEIEKKKKKLIEKSETAFHESLEKEKEKQSELLQREKAAIEKSCADGMERLKALSEEKSDEWVEEIVSSMISG